MAGAQNFDPLLGNNPSLRVFYIGLKPNGSNDPTVLFGRGVASAVHTATGKLTITLNRKNFPAGNMFANAQLRWNAATGNRAYVGTIDESAGTIVVWTVNASDAAADITGTDERDIFLTVVVQDSGLPSK